MTSPRLLQHKVNLYNGIEVLDPSTENQNSISTNPSEFERDLWHSLRIWKDDGRKGIWMKIHTSAVDLIPIAVRAGFKFHQANSDFLILNAWVHKDSLNKLPPGPNHFSGVAGFVLNSKNQVLCVKEKSGPSVKFKDFWKLPGGLCDNHENLCDAALREVREETGLDCEFISVASVQEIHNEKRFGGFAREGTTDLYCVCVLRALDEAQKLIPQEDEIQECKWIDLEQLLGSVYYSQPGTVFHKMFRAAAQVASGISQGLQVEKLNFGFRNTVHMLYANELQLSGKL